MSVDARDQAEKVRAIERAIHLAHSSHYIVGLNAEKELAALLAELASLKDALGETATEYRRRAIIIQREADAGDTLERLAARYQALCEGSVPEDFWTSFRDDCVLFVTDGAHTLAAHAREVASLREALREIASDWIGTKPANIAEAALNEAGRADSAAPRTVSERGPSTAAEDSG